jgi:hypothetical protein
MLATPKDYTAGTMPFASLPDVVAVAMKLRSIQHCAFIVETFLFNGDIVVKVQQIFHMHFTTGHHGKSSLRQCHTVMGRKVMTEFSRIKKETSRQCAYSVIATEY